MPFIPMYITSAIFRSTSAPGPGYTGKSSPLAGLAGGLRSELIMLLAAVYGHAASSDSPSAASVCRVGAVVSSISARGQWREIARAARTALGRIAGGVDVHRRDVNASDRTPSILVKREAIPGALSLLVERMLISTTQAAESESASRDGAHAIDRHWLIHLC